jgi:hypothetical protein
MVAALPYVSWSTADEAVIPAERWEYVYASLQAFKAHVQEYPGCQGFDVFARTEEDGAILVHCYTTWDTPEQAEAFGQRGYTFERLLSDLGDFETERSLMMEKIF